MLTCELGENGFAGVEIRVTPMRTEILIRATRTQNVLGEKGRRIRELTSVVQKRCNFPDDSVELCAEKVMNCCLCAVAQASLSEGHAMVYSGLSWKVVRRAARKKSWWRGCFHVAPVKLSRSPRMRRLSIENRKE